MDHNPKFTYLSLQLNHFLKNEFPIPNYQFFFGWLRDPMDFGSSIYLSKYCGLQIGFFLLREMLIDRYKTWLSLLPKVFINNKGFMCPNRMPQYYSFTIMVKFRYIYSRVCQ